MKEKFYTFKIEHAQRSENRYVNALAMLGLQIAFERSSIRFKINKWKESIIAILQERFQEKQRCEEAWTIPIREALLKEEDVAELKTLKDFILMKGELYHKMSGGILSRCIGHGKAQRKLKEVHSRTCGFCSEISLYPNCRKRISIGQRWAKIQTWPKPSSKLAT